MDSAKALREMIASWYRANRETLAKSPIVVSLAPHFTDPAKWDSYCKMIAEPGEWGDQLEILAIASLTNCAVTIVQTVGESQTYSPLTQDGEITGSTGLPELFLGYINGLHYTATSQIGTNVENDVEADTHGSGSGGANDVEADTHGNGSGGAADAGRDDSAAPLCYICKTIAKEGTAAVCPECNMHVSTTCLMRRTPTARRTSSAH
jgi:hypothetical protein